MPTEKNEAYRRCACQLGLFTTKRTEVEWQLSDSAPALSFMDTGVELRSMVSPQLRTTAVSVQLEGWEVDSPDSGNLTKHPPS